MKICMVAINGANNYTRSLCSALSGGASVTLATGPGVGHEPYDVFTAFPPMTPPGGYKNRVHWLGHRIFFYKNAFRNVVEKVRKDRADVVHFQQVSPSAMFEEEMFRALKRLGVRVVVTVHNIFTIRQYGRILDSLAERTSRAAWRAADALCVHSDELRNELSKFLGKWHPPIYVTEHGIRKYEQTEPGDALLFFGSIVPYKGLDLLLAAMPELPEFKLVVAGEPEGASYPGRIRQAVANIGGRVEYHEGYVREEDVPKIFAKSRIVVLPYRFFSSQSGVLHQAIGFGRPVVATDVGAMRATIDRFDVGEAVPPSNIHALVDAIRRVAEPTRYAACRNACKKAQDALTWEGMATETMNVYSRL